MRNEQALETPPEAVSVIVEGQEFTGTYRSGRGFVMMSSDFGKCVAQRGRMTAHAVAEILLRKVVTQRNTAGDRPADNPTA